jgi:hypothetical protein
MTLTDFKQVNFKSFNPKKDILYLILFTLVLIIIALLLKTEERKKITNFRYISAIVSEKSKVYLGGYNVLFNYNVKNEPFSSENSVKSEDFNKLEIGDTILIKYSNDDNSVAEIIHCYWNDEFRKLVKKQN